MPGCCGYIAQWLERLTADQQVPASNPGVPCVNQSSGSWGHHHWTAVEHHHPIAVRWWYLTAARRWYHRPPHDHSTAVVLDCSPVVAVYISCSLSLSLSLYQGETIELKSDTHTGAGFQDGLAEWSKALDLGSSPQGRGFKPHSR